MKKASAVKLLAQPMQLQLALHSSPRFSTWLWFNDWKTLIDAGDGASQQLGYKIRKIDTVLLTHSHRDHIGGLLQVINQRGEAGPFTLAHPTQGRSWRDMESFSLRFNPGTSRNAVWRALEEGDWIDTGVAGRLIKSFRTRHFLDDDPNRAPRSLGYHLIWRKNKVKPEYAALSQSELDAVRRELGRQALENPQHIGKTEKELEQVQIEAGRAAITAPVDEKWITIGGDGCPLSPQEVAGTQILLHEATFLLPDDYDAEAAGEDVGHMHSTVSDALRVAAEAGVQDVILYHISTRYSDQEIRESIATTAKDAAFKGRVYAAMPRRIYFDFAREKPVWEAPL